MEELGVVDDGGSEFWRNNVAHFNMFPVVETTDWHYGGSGDYNDVLNAAMDHLPYLFVELLGALNASGPIDPNNPSGPHYPNIDVSSLRFATAGVPAFQVYRRLVNDHEVFSFERYFCRFHHGQHIAAGGTKPPLRDSVHLNDLYCLYHLLRGAYRMSKLPPLSLRECRDVIGHTQVRWKGHRNKKSVIDTSVDEGRVEEMCAYVERHGHGYLSNTLARGWQQSVSILL